MKEKISSILSKFVKLPASEIAALVEVPKDSKLGDYAFPCFSLSKTLRKNPAEIAKDIAGEIKSSEFEKIVATGPYVNFFVSRSFLAKSVLSKIQKEKEEYGSDKIGKGRTIVIDLSSPNIAKPFGIGHLRSTMIGNSIGNICSALGYKVVRINYLGDWGTQFGKLIVAYKKSGSEKKLKENPIKYMLELYIQGNVPDLEQAARDEFKKLESGDKENLKLWKKFRELSLKEFDKIYKMLGVKMDVNSGESFYMKKSEDVVKELLKKKLLEESEDAWIINLQKYNLTNALIKKSDGTTVYIVRDLAAALERYKKYKFDRMFYEVGSEQTLHFQQLFKILELMGDNWAKDCSHIAHGLYLDSDGKKFATRKGKIVFMEDVIQETKQLAREEIKKREEKLNDKEIEKRAEAIALAAIIYGDLKNYRIHDIIFDIDRFVSFEGDTGPYLLYTYVRAKSILERAKYGKKKNYDVISLGDSEKNLIVQMEKFPGIIKESYGNLSPHVIAVYAYQLCQTFNEFYHSKQVIGAEDEQFRLVLVDSFSQVLKNALSLLGIKTIEKM